MPVLLYGSTIHTLTERLEKELDDDYKIIQRAVWHACWKQHYTTEEFYVY